jgi:MFS family permease
MLGALLGANALSMTGNMMAMLAVPWFVLDATGSAVKAGLAGFATFLPAVLGGIFGGTLVDAAGFKRSSVIADIASGVTVAVIPLLWSSGFLTYPLLLILVFLGALLDSPGVSARDALVPEAAARAMVPIERASAWADSGHRVAGMLGAPIGGLLIAALGPANVLWVDAATFLVSAAAIGLFAREPHRHEPVPGRGYLRDFAEGWRFVSRDAVFIALIPTFVITNFIDAGGASALMPVYGHDVLQSSAEMGLVIASLGMGALAGSLLYGWVGHRLPRKPLLIAGMALASLRFFGMAAGAETGVLIAAGIIGGIGVGPVNPIGDVLKYERTPLHLRARVFGIVVALAWAAMPLGALVMGFVVEAVGVYGTALVSGAVYVAATGFFWRAPVDDREPVAQTLTTRT